MSAQQSCCPGDVPDYPTFSGKCKSRVHRPLPPTSPSSLWKRPPKGKKWQKWNIISVTDWWAARGQGDDLTIREEQLSPSSLSKTVIHCDPLRGALQICRASTLGTELWLHPSQPFTCPHQATGPQAPGEGPPPKDLLGKEELAPGGRLPSGPGLQLSLPEKPELSCHTQLPQGWP